MIAVPKMLIGVRLEGSVNRCGDFPDVRIKRNREILREEL
jgi:hypothetical protein